MYNRNEPAPEPVNNSQQDNRTDPAREPQQNRPRHNPRLVIGNLDYFDLLMEQDEE